jgi:hypothetical protein
MTPESWPQHSSLRSPFNKNQVACNVPDNPVSPEDIQNVADAMDNSYSKPPVDLHDRCQQMLADMPEVKATETTPIEKPDEYKKLMASGYKQLTKQDGTWSESSGQQKIILG